jgi:NTP pyrophosphatase (non-canonical NTP hydrolase)
VTPNQYIKESARTDNTTVYSIPVEVEHGAMGISTEAGEIMDIVKKAVFYSVQIKKEHLQEELGDLLWYVACILRYYGWTFEEIMEINIEKLHKRYKEKFSTEEAIIRNDVVEKS